jgi:hypothetical protein
MKLSQKRLQELLHYNPETGDFTWLVQNGHRIKIGQKAGSSQSQGYWIIGVDGKRYHAPVLAWLYMTGTFPPEGFEIDHIDVNTLNNRFSNLRLATLSQKAARRIRQKK